MSLALYMDVHVPYPVTAGLLARGVALESDEGDEKKRGEVLDTPRCGRVGFVTISQDKLAARNLGLEAGIAWRCTKP